MGSPTSQLRAENNAATNLPLEAAQRNQVKLKQVNNNQGVKAYKEHIPTTGITSVYDE
jgi:hypothetical protein